VLRQYGDKRHLWGFDSFEGLPAPGLRDPAIAHRGFFSGWCMADENDVSRALASVNGDAQSLHTVKGWLSATLPVSPTGPIALLNIDVDWYESVRTTLEALFDRVSPGGIVHVDDYGRWLGCDAAVLEFLSKRAIPTQSLQRAGPYGAWFSKP
jgi:hypothetical protein